MPPDRAAQASTAQHDHGSARVLLAATAGALAVAGITLLTASDEPAVGSSAPAVVLSSTGCADGGQDTVSVRAATGDVTTRLDGCGQRVGATVSVQLSPDGSVGDLVALAGTRGAGGPSAVPAAVLLSATVVTVGVGVASLRARRAPRPPG